MIRICPKAKKQSLCERERHEKMDKSPSNIIKVFNGFMAGLAANLMCCNECTKPSSAL